MKLKKYIKLAALLGVVSIAMFSSGCVQSEEEIEQKELTYFNFDGHQYVRFNRYRQYGITHSPKCKCLHSENV